jgi:hypothetical protein
VCLPKRDRTTPEYRIEIGERMEQPSPVEGRITHDQWRYFQLRHVELHLRFQVEAGEDTA